MLGLPAVNFKLAADLELLFSLAFILYRMLSTSVQSLNF